MVARMLQPIPCDIRQEAGYSSYRLPGNYCTGLTNEDRKPFNPTGIFLRSPVNIIFVHVFGLWEEFEVPKGTERTSKLHIEPAGKVLMQLRF